MKKYSSYQTPAINVLHYSLETTVCASQFAGSTIEDLEEGDDVEW